MAGAVIQSVWPILALLAYLLITCVLNVLTADRRKVIDLHDRLRRCMELRRQYVDSHPAKEE